MFKIQKGRESRFSELARRDELEKERERKRLTIDDSTGLVSTGIDSLLQNIVVSSRPSVREITAQGKEGKARKR